MATTIIASDWELIQACRQSDQQAWDEVVNKYKRLVFSIALNYGLDQDDAAEVVQITFMMLLQGLDTLRRDSRLGGWLAAVARRNTWRLLERRRREKVDDNPLDEESTLPDETSQRQQERWELLEWLHQGLVQLDPGCRELLLALYFDPQQPAYSEVAARLGLAVGSIGPMRARCLYRLRHILNEE